MKISDDVDLDKIAARTNGYVGSDNASLCSGAAMQQIREKNSFQVTYFCATLKEVKLPFTRSRR